MTKRPNHLRIVTPMQLQNATTLHSTASSPENNIDTSMQRRTSLFTLDTSNSFSRSRRGSARSKGEQQQQRRGISGVGTNKGMSHGIQFNPLDLADISESPAIMPPAAVHPFEELHSAPPINKSSSPTTPQTDAEYDFTISEIVPGFLFLGPRYRRPIKCQSCSCSQSKGF